MLKFFHKCRVKIQNFGDRFARNADGFDQTCAICGRRAHRFVGGLMTRDYPHTGSYFCGTSHYELARSVNGWHSDNPTL